MVCAWEIREQKRVLVGVLHCDTVSTAWALGLRNLIIPGQVMVVSGMPYDHARNVIAAQALQGGFESVFYLDSDVIPPRDAILRLLRHRLPVVSGLYCRRSPPQGVPVMQKPLGRWVTNFVPGTMVDVDVVGSGCLLIHRSVLEKCPPVDAARGKRWFDWRVDIPAVDNGDGTVTYPSGIPSSSEDFVWCFPKGVWVTGEDVKRIEDVREGDLVRTHKGTLRKVLVASSRPYSGEMVRITTTYMRELECTPGHRLYVRTKQPAGRTNYLSGGQLFDGSPAPPQTVEAMVKKTAWLEAKDIRVGDWLHIPKLRFSRSPIKSFPVTDFLDVSVLHEFPDGKLGYSRTRKNALRLIPRINVTPELCRLMGYYLSEGFSSRSENLLSFAFGEIEPDLVRDCQELLLSEFGAKSSTRTQMGSTCIMASSTLLAKLFKRMMGTGAYNKHLPPFWNSLNRECLAELVKGYWWGDGNCSGKLFSMNSMSETLARGIQAALLKLGILCGVRTNENKFGRLVRVMSIPTKLAPKFASIVGYDDYDKTPAREQDAYFRERKEWFQVRVEKAETFLWEGEVFNLKVDERETFLANGVVVHNCLWVKHHLKIPILVDTAVQCRHVGYAEAGLGTFAPAEARTVT